MNVTKFVADVTLACSVFIPVYTHTEGGGGAEVAATLKNFLQKRHALFRMLLAI